MARKQLASVLRSSRAVGETGVRGRGDGVARGNGSAGEGAPRVWGCFLQEETGDELREDRGGTAWRHEDLNMGFQPAAPWRTHQVKRLKAAWGLLEEGRTPLQWSADSGLCLRADGKWRREAVEWWR